MKIAFTSSGNNLESKLDLRFGRAANFLVYDTETENIEIVSNTQNLNAVQGAGIQSAQNVAETGAEVLISGHCGPKAFIVLKAANIKVYNCPEMSMKEALEQFKQNKLEAAKDADVEGHWI